MVKSFKAQKIRFYKWASFTGILFLSVASPFCLVTYGFLTLKAGSVFALLAWSFSALLLILDIFQKRHQPFLKKDERLLDPKKTKERKVAKLIQRLAKKAKISNPKIRIHKAKDAHPSLNAYANSWPFVNQVGFSEELLKKYQNGLTKRIFKAKMAHEISHIQHQDAIYHTLLKIFKISASFTSLIAFSIILFSLTASSLILSSFALFMPLGIISACYIANEFLFAMWNRAKETLADQNAVALTKDPKAFVEYLYDKYYQLLSFGKLAYEGKDGGEKVWTFEDKSSVAYLKKSYKDNQHQPRKRTYFILKRAAKTHKRNGLAQHAVSTSLLWRFVYQSYQKPRQLIRTWFNDYPTCQEREAVILSTFPKAF